MPKISNKGKIMPESPIRKLVPYSEIAKKKGHKVYHLNIGQPDVKTPEVAMNAVKNIDLTILEYSHSAGNESYRKKLSAYYTNQGIPVNIEDIIITTGGSEALMFAMGSTMDQGDEIIIPANISTFINSLKVNIGLSLVGVISGEFLVSKAGLGYLIVYGGQVFKLDLVMTSVIILGIVAGIMYLAVLLLEKFIVKSRNA